MIAQLAAKASAGKPDYLANGALIIAQLAAKASAGKPDYLANGALMIAQLAAKASAGKPLFFFLRVGGLSLMWFVYILRSLKDGELYIGSTNDIQRRLAEHNSAQVDSTKHRVPLTMEAYVAVKDKIKAIALEQYLKTGSGKAILQKRIL